MFADPRSAAFADDFAGQWLETRNLDDVKPDPKRFPTWNPELRDAMRTETRLFFDYVFRENRPLSDFSRRALYVPEHRRSRNTTVLPASPARTSAAWTLRTTSAAAC